MTRSGHEKRTPITMWRPGLSSAGAEDVHASIRSVGNGVVELEVAGSRLPIEVALSFLGPAVGQADVLGKLVCIVGGRILLTLVGVLEVAKAGEIPPLLQRCNTLSRPMPTVQAIASFRLHRAVHPTARQRTGTSRRCL